MKIKYALLSWVLLGIGLPGIVFAKSDVVINNPPSVASQVENHASYRADLELMSQIITEMNIFTFEMVKGDNITTEDLYRAINASRDLQHMVQKSNFITSEGQQVKQVFTAFSEDLIQTYHDYPEWKNSKSLKDKYAEKLKTHDENIMNAIQTLKNLSEQ